MFSVATSIPRDRAAPTVCATLTVNFPSPHPQSSSTALPDGTRHLDIAPKISSRQSASERSASSCSHRHTERGRFMGVVARRSYAIQLGHMRQRASISTKPSAKLNWRQKAHSVSRHTNRQSFLTADLGRCRGVLAYQPVGCHPPDAFHGGLSKLLFDQGKIHRTGEVGLKCTIPKPQYL